MYFLSVLLCQGTTKKSEGSAIKDDRKTLSFWPGDVCLAGVRGRRGRGGGEGGIWGLEALCGGAGQARASC